MEPRLKRMMPLMIDNDVIITGKAKNTCRIIIRGNVGNCEAIIEVDSMRKHQWSEAVKYHTMVRLMGEALPSVK